MLEYVSLRLLRKFLFTYRFLLRFGQFIPYYRTNQNQADPFPIVKKYLDHLREENIAVKNSNILEIGIGATNSTGYELARQAGDVGFVFLNDPYVPLNEKEDVLIINAKKYTKEELSKVKRIIRPDESQKLYDLIFSYSVLEHVAEPEQVFSSLLSLLSAQGNMLHIVDYRDHFFKYPYHFLTFSKSTWSRFLNPGDLYRWRLGDHLEILEKLGLKYKLLEVKTESAALEKVRGKIKKEFTGKKHWEVTQASILVYR